jgi:putative protein-disulfide isomerase
MEPHARRLRLEYGARLAWRLVMGGMIVDWDRFDDPVNNVRRPAQMAPLWFHVGQSAGMPIDPSVWHDDPPSSSYPACLAVKAAGLQGSDVGEAYLRRLREAVMLRRRNPARAGVLLDAAGEMADDPPRPRLDLDRFREDLMAPAAAEAFGRDLVEVRDRGIARFPTLVVRRVGGPGLVVTGFRPFDALLDAMRRAAPDVRPQQPECDPVRYVRRWGRALGAEVAAALGLDAEVARRALDDAVEAGSLAHDAALAGGYRIGMAVSPKN